MSSHDHETTAALARLAVSGDGAVLGLALAVCAAASWAKYLASSAALCRIRAAPSARISDLRSLLPSSGDGDSSSSGDGGRLVVVRGQVQPRSAIDAGWAAIKSHGALVSEGSGERAVIVKRTQTCLYNERRGIFGWSFDFHALFRRCWKEQQLSSIRGVPFILVEDYHWPHAGYVHVNLDGSAHPLPLMTVYHHLHPIQATPFNIFQAIFGSGYPVALLDEEKILPVGKEVTAVGICRTRDGALEIKSCKDIPYFLSDLMKDDIETELAFSSRILFWSGILLGTLSVGILSYAIVRNWWRWKEWRQRRRRIQEPRNEPVAESSMDEEDIRDGELCVICLMRRRRSAFVPCGHLVCCPRCALAVEHDLSPKCPLCRQTIRSSIRIYDS